MGSCITHFHCLGVSHLDKMTITAISLSSPFQNVAFAIIKKFTELIETLHPSSQVTQLAGYFEPLIAASVGVTSKLKDHQQQMTFLDQTKTLAESALQMLYAAKEGGGNPKVRPFHFMLFFFLICCCSTSDYRDG